MTKPVNHWRDDEHVASYLAKADEIPHRGEGERVVLELLDGGVQRVLDLGTGDGRLMGLARLAHPDCTGLAVDFSPAMLDAAGRRFADDTSVEVIVHDLDDELPAHWGRFDAVVSSFAIHHVVDSRKRLLFAEVFDRLDPGGWFVNLEHVQSPTDELHRQFLDEIGVAPADDDPSNKLMAVEPQLEWLRDIGFRDVDCFWKWRELAVLAGRRP
ncbi:MAG: class I SAM-dependent methyltransferase [Acidimicrobiales bacterium]